jgi:DNA-directed RNA polymerase subunit RPC12/RpoP
MAEFKIACSKCGQKIRVDSSYAGVQISCPACQHSMVVPAPPTQTSAPLAPPTVTARPRWKFKLPKYKLPPWKKMRTPAIVAAVLAALIFASFHYGVWNSTKTIWKHWTALSGSKDQWSYADGKLTGHSTTGQSMLVSPGKYKDVTFSATVQLTGGEGAIAIRMQDADNGYYIVIGGGGGAGGLANGIGARGGGAGGFANGAGGRGGGAIGLANGAGGRGGGARGAAFGGNGGYISLERMKAGVGAVLDSSRGITPAQATTGQPIKIEVTANGPLIEVHVDGKKLLQYKDWNFSTGSIGVGVAGNRNGSSGVTFSQVAFH